MKIKKKVISKHFFNRFSLVPKKKCNEVNCHITFEKSKTKRNSFSLISTLWLMNVDHMYKIYVFLYYAGRKHHKHRKWLTNILIQNYVQLIKKVIF